MGWEGVSSEGSGGGVQSLSRVQLCSVPASFVHGTLQARLLEWVATSFCRGSSRLRDQTHISRISCMSRQILYH